MTSDNPVEKLQRQLYSLGMSATSNLGQSVAPATPVEPKDNSANVTGEITAHVRWLQSIQASGNSPEDWLQFTDFMRCNARFKDDTLCLTFLSRLYAKAIRAIPNDVAKDNISYVQLLINFAKLKCLNSAEEAREMFSHARHYGRGVALAYVASAQFELSQGNSSKALRFLQKGQEVDALPRELLDAAVSSLKAGQTDLSLTAPPTGHVRTNNEENKENVYNVSDHPSNYQTDHSRQSYSKDDHYQHPGQVVNDMSSSLRKTAQSGVSRSMMFTVSSERLAKTADHTAGLGLKLARIPSPASALNPTSQPVSSTDDVRALLQPSFKRSLSMTTPQNLQTLPSAASASNVRTRQSERAEINYDDGTVSFSSAEKISRGVLPDVSSSGSQDTAPLPPDSCQDSHAKLRSCHSTADCKTPSLLSSDKKFKRFTGKPMRVLKRTSLAQLTEGDRDSDDDDDDYFYKSMKPLPQDTPQHQKSATLPASRIEDSENIVDRSLTATRTTTMLKPQPWEPQTSPDTYGSDHLGPVTDQPDPSQMVAERNGCNVEAAPECAVKNASLTSNTTSSAVSEAAKPKRFVGKPLRIPKSALPTCHTTHSDGGSSDTAGGDDNDSGVMVSQGSRHATPPFQSQPAVVPSQPPVAMPSFPAPSSGSHGQMAAPLQVISVNGKLYTKLKMIGRGGSCKVYMVLDCKHNLRALKCVDLEGADEVTVAGYRNEIALLQRLQHSPRWVIKLYDFEYNRDTNQLHVVLERGDTDMATFFQRHSKDGSMTPELIRFYWTQMLNAVGLLHREGIIHLDLKPANFLLVAGDLKLIDFGIASAIQVERTSVTRDQQVGTVNYMSPEAIVDTCGGSRTDASGMVKPHIKIGMKSDVWSLGCILYSLVCGHTPFQHIAHFIAKMQAIINPNHAIDFTTITDPSLRDVLQKCLTRDPKQRPSVEEVLQHPYICK